MANNNAARTEGYHEATAKHALTVAAWQGAVRRVNRRARGFASEFFEMPEIAAVSAAASSSSAASSSAPGASVSGASVSLMRSASSRRLLSLGTTAAPVLIANPAVEDGSGFSDKVAALEAAIASCLSQGSDQGPLRAGGISPSLAAWSMPVAALVAEADRVARATDLSLAFPASLKRLRDIQGARRGSAVAKCRSLL